MQVIDPGHCYTPHYLDNKDEFDEQITDPNELQFVKRIGELFPGNTGEPVPGTTCQEVLRILVDRVKYLDNQVPCVENDGILKRLRDTIELFESRAARRHGIDYEEDFKNSELSYPFIEDAPICPECGHVICEHDFSEYI